MVSQIQSVLQRCDATSPAALFPPIGVLTTDYRTVWAKNRLHLMELSTQNQQ